MTIKLRYEKYTDVLSYEYTVGKVLTALSIPHSFELQPEPDNDVCTVLLVHIHCNILNLTDTSKP
jgi:hypothetical protein